LIRVDLREAMRTTGSARVFTDEPVGDDVLFEILDDARFAPSGGNRQPWRVAVVRDGAARRLIGELMLGVWEEYLGAAATGVTPFAFGRSIDAAPRSAPNGVIDDIEQVPVVLAIAGDLGRIALMDGLFDRPALVGGASVYPFCWNIILAARARGLGGVITTFLSRAEPDAAGILGLPVDHALAATIFLGHVDKHPTKLTRRPVESFTTVDRFDGPTFTG
jgi:nitroreductase